MKLFHFLKYALIKKQCNKYLNTQYWFRLDLKNLLFLACELALQTNMDLCNGVNLFKFRKGNPFCIDLKYFTCLDGIILKNISSNLRAVLILMN